MIDRAAGDLFESALADWLRDNTRTEQVIEPGASYA